MDQNDRRKRLRTYSQYTQLACALLSSLISVARKEKNMTVQELSDRTGLSRGMIQRIEKGNLKCEIGAVFEVAAILGVPLFEAKQSRLTQHLHQVQEKLILLPQSVRPSKRETYDDF